MTTYRLWPSANGPASANTYTGNFISGVAFTLKQGGCWFEGYWWWVASNGGTSAVKCALWSATASGAGTVVPGSAVTSGTLTASAWNYIPLAAPVQLATGYDPATSSHGSAYIAAVGVNGNFPDTTSQFNSGDTYAAGITNGPLFAYSGSTGSKPPPYLNGQGLFTTAGTDPAVTMPNQTDSGGDGGSNFWVDVQVSDTAPAGYSGSYRLWPNKYDASPVIVGDSAAKYDIDVEVILSRPCALNAVWFYSQAGAANLPTAASVWSVASGTQAAVNSSPAWKLPGGGAASAGGGWMYCAFTGVTLAAGHYRAGVYNSSGSAGSWSATDNSTDYWNAGAGGNGITNGPLSAPKLSSASSGWEYNAADSGASPPYSNGTATPAQGVFGLLPSGGDTYPQLYATGGSGQSQNYWTDIEVTPLASGLLMASGII